MKTMLDKIDTELKLKIMFCAIAIIEIPLGLMMLITPDLFISLLGYPSQDPIMFGVAASIWEAFGIISILALRNPMKFVPILLFQFIYKCVWFIGIILPLAILGQIQLYGIMMIIIFAVFVIGDILVIPWNTILEKEK
jgi:hypothetical protein